MAANTLVNKKNDNTCKWPPFNPFVRHPTSARTKLRMLFFGPLLVPIRLTGALTTLTCGLLWSYICSWGCDTSRPYSPLRRWLLLGGIGVLSRVLLFFYGFVWITESFEIQDPKERAAQQKASIVVTNHLGFAELLYLIVSYHCCFVSKEGNRALPFIGTVAEVMQSIFVDRGDSNNTNATTNNNTKAESTTAKLLARARAPPGTWPPLCVCPEGTTHTGHVLLKFATGAFRPGLPVQPICVSMPFDPDTGYDPSFSCCKSIVLHVLGLMAQPWNHMHVHHLALYVPKENERSDPVVYANHVREKMVIASQEYNKNKVQACDLTWYEKLPYEPNPKAQALGRRKLTERNGGVLPPSPVFTTDAFGNPLYNKKKDQ